MSSINVSYGSGSVALVLWIVMMWGDPDLLDALIHYLMAQ